MVGELFERLTVLKFSHTDGQRKYWLCKCDCGKEIIVPTHRLKSGKTKSCGCFRAEKSRDRTITHGLFGSRIYNIWACMLQRCNNPNHTAYPDYGGRGIKVCEKWHQFSNFYQDMASSYRKDLTLDRIDNMKGYGPENCKWSSRNEQARNKRSNHRITLNGNSCTIKDLATTTGISRQTLNYRLSKGMTPEEAISAPVRAMSKGAVRI